MDKRDSAADRLKDLRSFWHTHKTRVIRIILGTILVVVVLAQIIPPLGRLLSEGKFLGTGLAVGLALIVFDAILSPGPGVDSTGADNSVVLQHFSDLRQHIRAAFSGGVVELDIAAYSSETFYNVISEFLQDVLDGRERPHRLRIRLLLPDCTAPMAVPCRSDSLREDPLYKEAIDERNTRFIGEFRGYFAHIRQRGLVTDADFTVRVHRLSPTFKMIIINRTTAFFGVYPIASTPVTIAGTSLDMWDFRGERTRMVGVQANGRAADREVFDGLQQWFESVWANVSTDA